ncbi:MAG: hypothetical protein IIC67_04940 [Thaumarchaeota archaeon]|nr:hypothetical protein [Nitrososphaerota archaeon]
MTSLTPLGINLLQLLLVRNTLSVLFEMYLKPNHALTHSITTRYMILELSSFIDAQNSLMNKLTSEQKGLVLCLNPFLEEINANKTAIHKLRSGWIAHPQSRGKFEEDIMDLMERLKFSASPNDRLIMTQCAILYVDALKRILKTDFDLAHQINEQSRKPSELSFITDLNHIQKILDIKINSTKVQLRIKGFTDFY